MVIGTSAANRSCLFFFFFLRGGEGTVGAGGARTDSCGCAECVLPAFGYMR